MRLDHIGIAVHNLAESTKAFAALIGAVPEEVSLREVPVEKVRIAELRVGDVTIELMEPMSEDSPISGFLAKRGEGVHHLCYLTADIDSVFARLRASGRRVLSPAVREGSGYRYFFVHPQDALGTLTEFKQPDGGH